ncbi:MAG: ABC transporter permease [bacterium]|nr:ABC transporter permease [bacterium]
MIPDILENIGSKVRNYFTTTFLMGAFYFRTMIKIFKLHLIEFRTMKRPILSQIRFTLVEPFFFLVIMTIMSGTLVSVISLLNFPLIDVEEFMRFILVSILVKEVGPIIVSIIIISRSVTAIVSHLGNMKVSGEVRLLERLGIDPMVYIALPRYFGISLSFFFMLVYFDFLTIFVSFIVANFNWDISLNRFLEIFFLGISMKDFLFIVLKAIIIGQGLSVIATWSGLSITESSIEIPKVQTKAVVYSFIWFFVIDIIFNLLMV